MDSSQIIAKAAAVKVPKKHRKAQLVTLDSIDQRTAAAKRIRELAGAITSDLGGDLTAAQQVLVQRASIMAAIIEDQEARFARGELIDVGPYTTLVNSLRRVLADLGLKRIARDETLTLADYLRSKEAEPDEAELVEDGE